MATRTKAPKGLLPSRAGELLDQGINQKLEQLLVLEAKQAAYASVTPLDRQHDEDTARETAEIDRELATAKHMLAELQKQRGDAAPSSLKRAVQLRLLNQEIQTVAERLMGLRIDETAFSTLEPLDEQHAAAIDATLASTKRALSTVQAYEAELDTRHAALDA